MFAEAFHKAGEIKKEAMDKKTIKIFPDNQPATPPREPELLQPWRGPADFAETIHDVGYWRGDEAGPMAFIFGAHRANEFCVRIDQQAQRIGIEGNMRTVFLTVAGDALT